MDQKVTFYEMYSLSFTGTDSIYNASSKYPAAIEFRGNALPPYRNIRPNEPAREIMALFVLRKCILQIPMRTHPVGLDV